jgi:hypothetical protein
MIAGESHTATGVANQRARVMLCRPGDAARSSQRQRSKRAPKQSRANPKVDAAMKLLLPGAPNPEQVTPRGALRSMQRYRLHLGF